MSEFYKYRAGWIETSIQGPEVVVVVIVVVAVAAILLLLSLLSLLEGCYGWIEINIVVAVVVVAAIC